VEAYEEENVPFPNCSLPPYTTMLQQNHFMERDDQKLAVYFGVILWKKTQTRVEDFGSIIT